jgi:hypothetical protein
MPDHRSVGFSGCFSRVDPTIGFREVEVHALRKRLIHIRKYVVNAPKPTKPDFIPS